MATYERRPLMSFKDKGGDKHLMYPITKAECVDGLDALLAGKETPSGAQEKVNIVQANLNTHATNSGMHVTSSEKAAWDAKESQTGAQGKVDAVRQELSSHKLELSPHASSIYRKGECLSDATKSLLGLPATAVPDAAIAKIPRIMNAAWTKLASYETAGAFTWTAPDLFAGQPYTIGVLVIGAGGSGSFSTLQANITGGASGFSVCIERTVTPGVRYSLIVGTRGAAIASSPLRQGYGNKGGSSSFDGLVAHGGWGGSYWAGNGDQSIPIGAQSPIHPSRGRDLPEIYKNPFGGVPFAYSYGGSVELVLGVPSMCFNPFENKRMLAAGGSCVSNESDPVNNGGKDPITAKGGGDAIFANGGVQKAQDADAPGCGGGACIAVNGTATSGAGADGAVYIYVQGVMV